MYSGVVAVAFTVIIGALQIFGYERSVPDASLLKITVAAAGLALGGHPGFVR